MSQLKASCTDHTPPWFVGHWRDWHRGHGCDKDDGKPRADVATTEIEQHATNESTGFLTDAELNFLRASTTSGNDLLVRALNELSARRASDKPSPSFDHSTRTTKYFEPLLGLCVCTHCQKLPELPAHGEENRKPRVPNAGPKEERSSRHVVNPDNFLDRYATCPLCRRDNVRLRHYAGSVVLDEHSMGDVLVGAYRTPVPPDTVRSQGSTTPLQLELAYARVRCPAALAPLLPREDS